MKSEERRPKAAPALRMTTTTYDDNQSPIGVNRSSRKAELERELTPAFLHWLVYCNHLPMSSHTGGGRQWWVDGKWSKTRPDYVAVDFGALRAVLEGFPQ